SDYKPTADVARDALKAGLSAWSEGKRPEDVTAASPGKETRMSDFQWTAGKRLKRFRLLDDNPTLQASPQMFRVQLELEGSPSQDVEYYVVGKQPALWVWRDRDYRALSME